VIRGEAADAAGRYLVNASRCGERLSTEWRHPDGTLAAYEEVELAEGRWVRYRLQRANVGQDLRADGGVLIAQIAEHLGHRGALHLHGVDHARGLQESKRFVQAIARHAR
jgi:hypothetical protein